MKIQLLSDVHLEFQQPMLPYIDEDNRAEVLVLAGDICMARTFGELEHEYFDFCSKNFERVFYVMGNHEHYKNLFNDTEAMLRDKLSDYKNVMLLQNSCVKYNGYRFVGATLWTDNNRGCPITENVLQNGMSDFRVIKYRDESNNYYKLSPRVTRKEHLKSITLLEEELQRAHEPMVVITHHAPSAKSIAPAYRNDVYMNGGYYSDLEYLLGGNIKLYCHGHMHNSFDYNIKGTRVVCNPVGYPGERRGQQDLNFIVDI